MYCDSLASVTLSKNLTSIGYKMFYECSSLASIVIPEGVTELVGSSFYGCKKLTDIVLPKSLKTIGTHTFYSCEKLIDVYCYADEIPSILYYDFYGEFVGCPLHKATLHVPANLMEEYKSTRPWSNFANIVALTNEEDDSTSISSTLSQPVLIQCLGGAITLTGIAEGLEVVAYNTSGQVLATAIATDGTATLTTGLEVGSTAMVKIGKNSIKIVIR